MIDPRFAFPVVRAGCTMVLSFCTRDTHRIHASSKPYCESLVGLVFADGGVDAASDHIVRVVLCVAHLFD
jgi:hypothetical protein